MSSDELYRNPGNFVFEAQANGAYTTRMDGDRVFLSGQGASPQGDRPFLDRLDRRRWRANACSAAARTNTTSSSISPAAPASTSPAPVGDGSAERVPAHARRGPGRRGAGRGAIRLRRHPAHPGARSHPGGAQDQEAAGVLQARRWPDLSFTLYTPPGYQPGTRRRRCCTRIRPTSPAASRPGRCPARSRPSPACRTTGCCCWPVTRSSTTPASHRRRPEDRVRHLPRTAEADAGAAVDKAVEMGVVDRDRIGVTGHSHGALMTANLIAHTDLFKAGVATSGSYNKTLTRSASRTNAARCGRRAMSTSRPRRSSTPTRSSRRCCWYMAKTTPTPAPSRSSRASCSRAIRGNGGTTRLVMLPHEPHWYTALESNEQVVYEMLNWFDAYVKNAPATKDQPASAR